MRNLIYCCLILTLFTSCVSKRKYLEMKTTANSCEQERTKLQGQLTELGSTARQREMDVTDRENQIKLERNKYASLEQQKTSLEQQLDDLKKNNTNLLARLSDLSVVSKTGAENISKSLQAINEQNRYIQGMTNSMQRKDSLNLVLVMNLKRSLADVNDQDVTVEVKKGVVYISLSDKMLFKSGSSDISPQAEGILGKIAKVVNDHRELDILVEGHTDNVPITTACLKDNWDLSAMRATAVVRLLQTKYNVAPERMTAGGRSEFVPKNAGVTAEARSTNRRTEIVILPKLDQFFQLMEKSGTGK